MLGLTLDTKTILIAAGVALAVLLGVGAFLYHEGTTAALRADLEKARKANAQAAERNLNLETLVRESAAEVEAANRAAKAARDQAARNDCVAKSFDRARARNRKALADATGDAKSIDLGNAAPTLAATPFDAGPLWARINELFGLCGVETCPVAGGGASAPGLPEAATP